MKRAGFVIALAGLATAPLSARGKSKATPVPGDHFVEGSADVVLREFRIVSTSDGAFGNSDLYYICKITFTNDLGQDFSPQIQRFVLEGPDQVQYTGVDSGNQALIGISNHFEKVKVGESHDYTVAFRVPANTQGKIYYDPTL